MYVSMETIKGFTDEHSKDLPQATFNIGEKVRYKHSNLSGHGVGTVTGVADTGNGIEYAVTNLPYLLWENEIQCTVSTTTREQ